MKNLTEKVLKHNDRVEFDWCDSKASSPARSYGRAEFMICQVWRNRFWYKRPRLLRFYIYPKQQRDVKHFYRVDCWYSDSFQVMSWTHKGLEEPKVWRHSWCKEHGGPSFNVYVPRESKSFTVSVLSTAGINFDVI